MNDETTPVSKTKRARKPSKPRARKPKPQAILDIEVEAAAKKALYRQAQSSGGVLKRISEKMIPRLTLEHRQELFDLLSLSETPSLLKNLAAHPISDNLEHAKRSAAETGMAG